MCAVLVGDVEWLSGTYDRGGSLGSLELQCLSGEERDFDDRVSSSAVVVMITDQTSHSVRRQVLCVAAANSVPVCMRHSCGMSCVGARLRGVTANR